MTASSLLIAINFIWLAYLTFIVYIKNKGAKTKIKIRNKQSDPGITKFKLSRFNPFDNLGGDQSFILVLLDNNNSGVIITSLHNRNTTRIYAKPIKTGQGDRVALSKEEKNILNKLIKS